MKKIYYFVVVAMLSMTMVACGGNAEKKAEKSEEPIDKVLELQDEFEAAVEAGDYEKSQSLAEQMQELLKDPKVLEAYQKEMMKAADDLAGEIASEYEDVADAFASDYEEAVEEVADAYEDALSEYEDEYEDAVEDAVNAYEDAVEDAVSAYEDALSGLDW